MRRVFIFAKLKINMILAKNLNWEVEIVGDTIIHDNTPVNTTDLPYRQSTSAIILDNNNLILLIQKVSYQDDQWAFPGGGVDVNEAPEQAITRELSEEIGLREFKIKSKSDFVDEYDWPKTVVFDNLLKKGILFRGQQVNYFLVNLSLSKPELELQEDEIKQYKWVNIEDISKYLVFPNQLSKTQKVLRSFGLAFS